MTHLDPRALEAALRAAISDSDASDLAKRMNGGWSAQAALERAMRDAIPEAIVAYLAALQDTHALVTMSDDDALRLSADIYDGMLSEPSSPQSKLSGSFEAETELSAAPGAVEEIRDHSRELLAEALEALDGMLFFVGELPGAQYSAHVHAARAAADKIRAALTEEKQT